MVKKTTSITVDKEFSKLVKKEFEKKVKSEALKKFRSLQAQRKAQTIPSVSSTIQQVGVQQQQSRRRQRFVDIMGSRAEQLEIQAVSFDEVPMLHDMERQRSRKTTVSNRFLNDTEKGVTDSFPD